MRLLIKQRVFTLRDTFDVYDEQNAPVWFIESKLFSFAKEIFVYDSENRQVAAIRQRLWHLMPRYELWIGDQYCGCIQKRFSFLPRYELEYSGWRVDGDFLGWDYDVLDDRGVVASIRKELLHWGDTYVIDISDPENELICLLIVLAIDAANAQASRNS